MRASDVAWAWVAQQVRDGRARGARGASVSSRNREAGWLRGAGAVETGGTGDHGVGRRTQAEDQQGDTVKGGAFQAGAEERLQPGYTTGNWQSDWG